MYYDIYVTEEDSNGDIISETMLYNSEHFDIKDTIGSVIKYIEKEFIGCITENIITLSKVKFRLNKYNYFIFEDFEKHKHTFVLRKWSAGSTLINKDIFIKTRRNYQ